MKKASTRNRRYQRQKSTQRLSDDFRRLMSPPKLEPDEAPILDYCPVCLDTCVDPRTLACNDTFCRACLQYVINTGPRDSDSDRGFPCILCGHFTKVLNYSIPRNEWAEQIPVDYRVVPDLSDDERKGDCHRISEVEVDTIQSDDSSHDWFLDWKLSQYSKSYLVNNHIAWQSKPDDAEGNSTQNDDIFDASDDTPRQRRKAKHEQKEFGDVNSDNTSVQRQLKDGRNRSDAFDEAEKDKQFIEGESDNNDEICYDTDVPSSSTIKPASRKADSKIISATFHGDDLIIYDEGLEEILIYDSHLLVKTTIKKKGIHSITVLHNLLYMTNPGERCIEVFDIADHVQRASINITLKCYGINTFSEHLVVLLCDSDDKNFHVAFLDNTGVTGTTILLKSGHYTFSCPRQLTVCPLTQLIYVSDGINGLVKCYHLDGRLSWEKVVFGVSAVTVCNGYLTIARHFTNSLDVLSGRGMFHGRMDAQEYGLVSPGVVVVNPETIELFVVDEKCMMHIFKIRRCLKPSDEVETVTNQSACNCIIS